MKTRLLIFFMLSLIVLSGCMFSTYKPIIYDDYSAKEQMFDLTFGWNQSISGNKFVIDGYVRNNRYYIVNNLELQVSLVDKDGRQKTRETFFFIPADLRLDDSTRFNVSLNAHPQSGDLLNFYYRYNAYEGDAEAFTWVNNFKVNVLE